MVPGEMQKNRPQRNGFPTGTPASGIAGNNTPKLLNFITKRPQRQLLWNCPRLRSPVERPSGRPLELLDHSAGFDNYRRHAQTCADGSEMLCIPLPELFGRTTCSAKTYDRCAMKTTAKQGVS
jgi:hypothetical protein